MSTDQSFEDLVLSLLDTLGERGTETHGSSGQELLTDDMSVLIAALEGILRRQFSSLGSAELEDIADEALVRFADAATEGRVDREKNPIGYLIRVAQNVALTRLRKSQRDEPGASFNQTSDDAIASLLDARASKEIVRSAMASAVQGGDMTTARVIRVWLDLAEESGSAPSAREVAARVEMSHTAVLNALKRFKSYFPEGSSGM